MRPLVDCGHVPRCPFTATRFACGQRTRFEDAVGRGLITRSAALSLLTKWGVPMSSEPKVNKGERVNVLRQEPLL